MPLTNMGRIPRQPLFSSAYAPDEFSCLTWTFHRQAHVRQQSALPIFLWRTYSRINLRCWFFPLLAWLPAPLGPVLDSLPKCASHAHLTLLHIASNIFLMSYGFSNGMNILSKRCHLRMFHLLNPKKREKFMETGFQCFLLLLNRILTRWNSSISVTPSIL